MEAELKDELSKKDREMGADAVAGLQVQSGESSEVSSATLYGTARGTPVHTTPLGQNIEC